METKPGARRNAFESHDPVTFQFAAALRWRDDPELPTAEEECRQLLIHTYVRTAKVMLDRGHITSGEYGEISHLLRTGLAEAGDVPGTFDRYRQGGEASSRDDAVNALQAIVRARIARNAREMGTVSCRAPPYIFHNRIGTAHCTGL